MTPFADRLCFKIRDCGNPVMVGIDPRWEQLPRGFRDQAISERGKTLRAVAEAYERFAIEVIDAVADLAPIVKFQAAFFEAAGPLGLEALRQAMRYARKAGLLIVLDGKRNDIGATATAYAQAYLGAADIDGARESAWDADALTVNPYLGSEGIEPFLVEAEKSGGGVFLLVRTSNKGAGELQELETDGKRLYERVADKVEAWSSPRAGETGFGPMGAVVGATVPAQIGELRARMPHAIMLLPGYGAQGGRASDIGEAFRPDGLGAVVNNSRGIIFAHERPEHVGKPFVDAVRDATRQMIDDLAAHTPARRLSR